MKVKYPYSHELKKPMSFGSYDLSQIAKDGRMEKVANFIRKQSTGYKTKLARVEKKQYSSFDLTKQDYYEFTPYEEKDLYPAMIYFHGGGFMFPIQKPMMMNSSLYCKYAGIKVFLPEYRLSLDSPCRTTLEDCYSMLTYVFEHAQELRIDTQRIFVYGDSAGGCLAAGVTLLNRDRTNYPLCGQMLLYPVCDCDSDQYESMRKYKDAVWSRASNLQMWRLYFSRGTELENYIVPMKNSHKNLPPAYIEPQQYDTLRDEAIAYANKLAAAGVPAELNLISGSYHGFDSDLKSPLVKRVFEKRYQVIQNFIQ